MMTSLMQRSRISVVVGTIIIITASLLSENGGVTGFKSSPLRSSTHKVLHSAALLQKSLHANERPAKQRVLCATTVEKILDDDPVISYKDDDSASPPPYPGLMENDQFDCDESVKFWHDILGTEFPTAEESLARIAEVASNFARLGPGGINFWTRHVARSGYFFANAALGTSAYRLHDTIANRKNLKVLLDQGPLPVTGAAAARLLAEACLSYQQDYEKIRKGAYRPPWDMELGHRQYSPLHLASKTTLFVQEAIRNLSRRSRGEEKDKKIWISDDASPKLYPDYYRTAFHYQTDGWMSKGSADVYDTSTETLFLGRQDAMQRTALPPILGALERGKDLKRPVRVLEVACGTGRFMTFVRDNLPLDAEYTAVDLSPYYLETARENDAYWRKMRSQDEKERDGSGKVSIPPARLVQAQAEALPFDDGSFDVVLCVYLFHELPREVRALAVEEMARVLVPGGTAVLTDSVQRGDRPLLDDSLGNFEAFNEPYYVDYIADHLPSHFEAVGMQCGTKAVRSTTKTLSFEKTIS